MKKITIINGPNLNMLGQRNPEVYGAVTLEQILQEAKEHAKELGIEVSSFQSNIEGEIVNAIQQSVKDSQGIIINPGAYTHTSIAIRDALECCGVPIVEVHLSNIFKREAFRHHSHISPVANGMISGFGGTGYKLALSAIKDISCRQD